MNSNKGKMNKLNRSKENLIIMPITIWNESINKIIEFKNQRLNILDRSLYSPMIQNQLNESLMNQY